MLPVKTESSLSTALRYHPLKLEISSKATCLNAAVMCLKHGAAKAQKVIDQELVQIEK